MVWCGASNRTAWANLLFAMTAASTAAFTLCELRLMRVGTPAELLFGDEVEHMSRCWVWLVSTTGS